MKIKYLLIASFIINVLSFPVPPELASVCPEGCKKFYNCDPIEKKCVYKGLFPLYPSEIIEMIIISIISFFTQICGASGGMIYSKLLMEIQEFSIGESFSISAFIILSSALVIYIIGHIDKCKNEENSFVNYSVATIFCPIILIGLKIGYFLQIILPEFIVSCIMAVILLFCFYYVYKSFINEKYMANKNQKEPLLDMLTKMTRADIILLEKSKSGFVPIRPHLIILLLGIVLAITDLLIEGNLTFNSLVGIQVCSVLYWFILSLYIILLVILVYFAFIKLGEIEKPGIFNTSGILRYKFKTITIGLLIGICSQISGIGGGIIITPFISSFNIPGIESVYTSNFIMFCTFIVSCIIYALSYSINYSFLLMINAPCLIFSICGGIYFSKKANENGCGIILFKILMGILFLDILMLIFHESFNVVNHYNSFWDLLALNPYCI